MGNKDRLFFRSVTGTEKSLPHLFFMREVGDGYRIVGLEMSPKVNGR